jgi:ubiquitin-protein ligase
LFYQHRIKVTMTSSSKRTGKNALFDPFWHRIVQDCLDPSLSVSYKANTTERTLPENSNQLTGQRIIMREPVRRSVGPPEPSVSRVFPQPTNLVILDDLQEEREQALRDYKVTIEYKHLKSHAPGGVYVIPSLDDLRTFYGIIFVRRGVFANGIFKFVLRLPLLYNDVDQHPRITFQSEVYNPYVDEATGELDIKTAYPNWDPSKHYLVTVLTFLKKIFYAKSFGDAQANMEARQLAEENTAVYRARVDACVSKSQKDVYDNDPESVAKFTEEQLSHRVLRDLLKANVKDPAQVSKTALLSMISKASNV